MSDALEMRANEKRVNENWASIGIPILIDYVAKRVR